MPITKLHNIPMHGGHHVASGNHFHAYLMAGVGAAMKCVKLEYNGSGNDIVGGWES